MRARHVLYAALGGAGAALLGSLFGRIWVLIGLVAGYVGVSMWVRYEERKLLETLRALPEEERERVLAHDPELGNELRRKLQP
jgi:protein-S-isoprenylcysteine O-methyltransferase Ste14